MNALYKRTLVIVIIIFILGVFTSTYFYSKKNYLITDALNSIDIIVYEKRTGDCFSENRTFLSPSLFLQITRSNDIFISKQNKYVSFGNLFNLKFYDNVMRISFADIDYLNDLKDYLNFIQDELLVFKNIGDTNDCVISYDISSNLNEK